MRRNRYWSAQALMAPRPGGDPGGRRREVSISWPARMKEYYCGAIMPGCDMRIVAATEDELLRSMDTHARVDHGMTEIPPELIKQAREGIRDVEPAVLGD